MIFTYIGGRIFLDQPVLGTGWHGLLPPEEFVRYLPDARERFSDQPAHYFPPADGVFIPQQTYDQILFELGLVGASVLAVLLALAGWRAAVVARRRDPDAAYIPAMWLAAVLGATRRRRPLRRCAADRDVLAHARRRRLGAGVGDRDEDPACDRTAERRRRRPARPPDRAMRSSCGDTT